MHITVPSISNQGRGELGRNGMVSAGRDGTAKFKTLKIKFMVRQFYASVFDTFGALAWLFMFDPSQ